MSKSQSKILKSSMGVAFATLLSRVLGLVRVMFEARVLGGGSIASAWYFAFAIPNLFRRILGEGALGTALIPLISEAEAKEGPDKVRRDLALILMVLSAILALIVVMVAGIAIFLRNFAFNPWTQEVFPVLGTERIQLALGILPLLMPYAFFICLIGAIGAVLNTRRIFVIPALGALSLNFFLIGGLGYAYYWNWKGGDLIALVHALSYLVLFSGALQLVLMLIMLGFCGRFPLIKKTALENRKILSELWRLVLPGMVGGAALQVSFLIDRGLALFIGPQAVPALTNVDRIIDLPIGIFAIAIGSVLMADMSRTAAKGDYQQLAADLVFSLRHVYFVCVPMAVLVIFFWQPILRMLCLGGNYTESDLEATRYVAIFYGAGIPSFCALKVILPAFYSRKIMTVPLRSSLMAIMVNILLNLCLMWHLQQGGIALSTVLASFLNNAILLRYLYREQFDLQPKLLCFSFVRAVVIAVVCAVGLYFLYPVLREKLTFNFFGEFPAFLALLTLFGIGYLGLSFICKAREIHEFFGKRLHKN